MASIEIRDTKDGKRAYRFRTLIGKDASGKRIFETAAQKENRSTPNFHRSRFAKQRKPRTKASPENLLTAYHTLYIIDALDIQSQMRRISRNEREARIQAAG